MVIAVVQGMGFCRDRPKFAVSHSFLRNHRASEAHHSGCRSAQDDAFDAVIVVEMRVQGRDRDIVMIVLHGRQPSRQIALMMVVDVTQDPDAVLGCSRLQLFAVDLLAQQVPKGLRAVLIASFLDHPVEGIRQVIIDRYRESSQIPSSLKRRCYQNRIDL